MSKGGGRVREGISVCVWQTLLDTTVRQPANEAECTVELMVHLELSLPLCGRKASSARMAIFQSSRLKVCMYVLGMCARVRVCACMYLTKYAM